MKGLSDYKSIIEGELKSRLNTIKDKTEEKLFSAMEYALMGGGKRVRPTLMLLSAETIGMPHGRVLPLAAALECIHTYSLIHDDLPCMDNDDYRRGAPTVHKAYSEATAVLAGDGLLNFAFEIMLSACLNDPALLSAAKQIAEAAGATGMAGGQAMDISKTQYTESEMLNMYSLKTGALIKAAICAPYIAAASPNLGKMTKLAGRIGLVFQLVDDILDYKAGQDKDKLTFVTLFGEEKAGAMVCEANREIKALSEEMGIVDTRFYEYAEALSHRLT